MKIDSYGCKLYELSDILNMPYNDEIKLWEEAHSYLDAPGNIPFEVRKEAIKVAFSPSAIVEYVTNILPPERQGKIANGTQAFTPSCYYVVSKKTPSQRGFYTAVRVTMHPDTAANIARGSSRYGAAKIASEVQAEDERFFNYLS